MRWRSPAPAFKSISNCQHRYFVLLKNSILVPKCVTTRRSVSRPITISRILFALSTALLNPLQISIFSTHSGRFSVIRKKDNFPIFASNFECMGDQK